MPLCPEFALSLIRQPHEAALIRWLITVLEEHISAQGTICGLLDISGRYLHCTGSISRQPAEFILEAMDFSHPLAGILHKGQPALWDTLHGGARTENPQFRQILATAGSQCGLFAIPIKDEQQRLSGVLALLDRSPVLLRYQQNPALVTLLTLFASQLVRLRQLASSSSEKNMLRQSLHHMTDAAEQQRHKTRLPESQLIGQSAVMSLLRQKILQASAHSLSVVIEGESGSGKNVVAELLHQCSARAAAPFVVVNCAAIGEDQLETELFGCQKGALSATDAGNNGALVQASGGTLFLDDIDALSGDLQRRLLWTLETCHYHTDRKERMLSADFRLISASRHCLHQQVASGLFHQELYRHLARCLIPVSPLREHAEDIVPLCQWFIGDFARRQRMVPAQLSPEFTDLLLHYRFPGNVRELKILLELACSHTAPGSRITDQALPGSVRQSLYATDPLADEQQIHDLRLAIRQYEQRIILSRLHHCQGNRDEAAKSLNIPRRTFDHKCRKPEAGT